MSPLALALLAAVPPQEQAAPLPGGQAAPMPAVQQSPPPAGAPELSDPLTDPAAPSAAAPQAAVGEAAKQPPAVRALETASPEALVRAHPRHAKGDPLEGLNRKFFNLNTKLDHAIFRPAALGYRHAVPRPVRSGLRNFFSNLMEPVVFLNFLLQLKPGKAAETLGRFTVNSTIGLAGLVDVAKKPPFKLPHRDNGFGSTLGRYGVGPGPYLYLPFAGPTTLRDLLGGQADRLVLPFTVQRPPFDRYEFQVPKAVITGLDAREQADDELKALYAGAVDPYATLRSVFLQNRAGEIEALRHPHAAARAAADPVQGAPAAPAGTPDELKDPLADPVAAPPAKADAPAPAPAPAPTELSDPLTDPASASPAPVAADPAAPVRK